MVAEGCLIPSQPSMNFNSRLTTVGNHRSQATAAQQFDYLCMLLVRFGDNPRNELGRHGLQLVKSIPTIHDVRMKTPSRSIGQTSAKAPTPIESSNQPIEISVESTQKSTAEVSAAPLSHQPMSTFQYATNLDSCSHRGIAPTGAATRTRTRSSNESHPTELAVAADCDADTFQRIPTGSLQNAVLHVQPDVAGEVQLRQLAVAVDYGADNLRRLPIGGPQNAVLHVQRDVAGECKSSQMPVKPDASEARCQSDKLSAVPDAAVPVAAVPDAAEPDAIEPDAAGTHMRGGGLNGNGANSDDLLVNTRLLNLQLGGRYPQNDGTLNGDLRGECLLDGGRSLFETRHVSTRLPNLQLGGGTHRKATHSTAISAMARRSKTVRSLLCERSVSNRGSSADMVDRSMPAVCSDAVTPAYYIGGEALVSDVAHSDRVALINTCSQHARRAGAKSSAGGVASDQ